MNNFFVFKVCEIFSDKCEKSIGNYRLEIPRIMRSEFWTLQESWHFCQRCLEQPKKAHRKRFSTDWGYCVYLQLTWLDLLLQSLFFREVAQFTPFQLSTHCIRGTSSLGLDGSGLEFTCKIFRFVNLTTILHFVNHFVISPSVYLLHSKWLLQSFFGSLSHSCCY